MQVSRNHIAGNRKHAFGLILLLFVSVLCLAFGRQDSDRFDTSRREVLLRRIGHELLLQSGDSTSRVLPVKKTGENEYQIRFENQFSFLPDSLVKISERVLADDPLASEYVVKVLNCDSTDVTYGFAISENKTDDIVACIGRRQPSACYMLNITFRPAGLDLSMAEYLLGSLPLLALIGFMFVRPVRSRKALPEQVQDVNVITLGSIVFDPKARTLLINGSTTDLTGTESRLMLIFANSPNETIERSRLQKEIWEDEGVIVGRSLDMFISKLRKKLEADPGIKILVVRGKGYRLEVIV